MQATQKFSPWDAYAWFCISAFAMLSLWLWAPSNFVKITADGVGEAFEAYHASLNVFRFGLQWGGLQDMATNPDPLAHPFLYIHHGNLGLYVSYVLGYIGITTLEGQNLATLIASMVGLLACYTAIRVITNSRMIAALFLFLLALDWNFIDHWALNLHRAFSYLSVMGTVYTFWQLRGEHFKSIFWFFAFFILCLTLLFSDYMFYFFTFIFLVLMLLINGSKTNWKSTIQGLFYLGAVFVAIFALRQLQVIWGAGLEIWKHDFLYQILNRIHMERLFPGDWPSETTDFYARNSILNPGFAPSVSWRLRLLGFFEGTGQTFLVHILGMQSIPRFAALPTGVIFLGTLISMMALHGLSRFRRFSGLTSAVNTISFGATSVVILSMAVAASLRWQTISLALGMGLVALSLAIVMLFLKKSSHYCSMEKSSMTLILSVSTLFLIACLSMYALFPRYFYQWYPSFLLAPLCVSIWTVALISPSLITRPSAKSFAPAIFMAMFSLKVILFWPSLLEKPVDQGKHAAVLRSLSGKTVASNFTPASVSSYTRAFSGWLKNDAVQKLLSEGRVAPSDYFMLFEADRSNPLYTTPQYYVFFKKYGADADLENIRSGNNLVAENDAVAVFKVPSTGY
jgi:hypothetical protein